MQPSKLFEDRSKLFGDISKSSTMYRIKQKILGYIPEPINIYSSLHPIHILSRFCLLSMHQRKQNEEKDGYEISLVQVLINAIGVLCFIPIYFYAYSNMYVFEVDRIETTLQYIGGSLSAVLALVEIVLSMVLAKFMLKIYCGIDEIEGLMRSLGLSVRYKYDFLCIMRFFSNIIFSLLNFN